MAATPGRWLLAASSHHWPPPVASDSSARLSYSPNWLALYRLCTDPTENIASNGSSIVACVSVAAVTWSSCRGNMFTDISGSAIPAVSRHVTIFKVLVRSNVKRGFWHPYTQVPEDISLCLESGRRPRCIFTIGRIWAGWGRGVVGEAQQVGR
jgi:hypothetical protein